MPCESVGRVGAIAVLLFLVATACTATIDGSARPAPGITPRPLTGDTVKKVLLDEGELAKALGQSLKTEADSPPSFGGPDLLFDTKSSPRDCSGVAFELQKSAYGSASVRNIGHETWWNQGGSRAKVISVSEVVVALPSAGDADALFADFTSQWQRCDGTTVTDSLLNGEPFMTSAISDVRAANSVLAATVKNRISTTVVNAHALGVRVNCLVDARVAYFTDHADNTAVDLAHRMMDKVSALS